MHDKPALRIRLLLHAVLLACSVVFLLPYVWLFGTSWKLDKEILPRSRQRDTIGWGYTLFLPWGTYSPTITAIHMKVRYEPSKGLPLYSEDGTITLNSQGNANVRTEARTIAPSTEKKEATTKR